MFTITADEREAGPHPGLVLLLCAVYLLAGIVGHDPWKSEDALHIGIAYGLGLGGDHWLPAVAGEPWAAAEPLYYWVAAMLARAASPWLPFHDAARLASAVFGALLLAALAGTARAYYGRQAAWGAPLLAIGTLGLLVPIHQTQPAIAMLAAVAGAYWGAAKLLEHPLAGGLILGTSVGAAFLAGGLDATVPILPLLLAPLIYRRWTAFAVAFTIAAAVAAIWPMVLIRQAPNFLEAWWSADLTAIATVGRLTSTHLQWLGWFVWPVQFVALWMLWSGRRHLSEPQILVPAIGLLVGLIWFLSHAVKPVHALPMLPPLILLASAGIERLRRGAANAWDWLGMMTFTIIAALIWLGAVAMLTGWPPKIAHNFAKLEPGFTATFSLPAILFATAATVLWLAMLVRLPRSPWRVATRWAAGASVVWILLTSLWLPWIDYGKTYRPVVAGLVAALPENPGCIGRRGLGDPQRALLDYFGGIRTRWDVVGCDWLISQDRPEDPTPVGWRKVWQGHRPGEAKELWRLYRRQPS